jgi:hypothetical protein
MSGSLTTKPATDEYAPYYGRYVDLVPAGNIIATLRQQMRDTISLIAGLTEQQALHRYSPGKWSLKEVIGHIIDSERIFAYRALRIARNDKTPLPGFEQDGYVINGPYHQRERSEIAKEYEVVREASIYLLEGLSEEAWDRRGKASEAEVSVRAMGWIISGHEIHHKNVIRERYL